MYAWIVFSKRSVLEGDMKHCESRIMFKSKIESNEMDDRFFYENIMMFSFKTLKLAFEK